MLSCIFCGKEEEEKDEEEEEEEEEEESELASIQQHFLPSSFKVVNVFYFGCKKKKDSFIGFQIII